MPSRTHRPLANLHQYPAWLYFTRLDRTVWVASGREIGIWAGIIYVSVCW